MAKGGNQQQTQMGTNAPWGPAQPGLQMGINATNQAFQSGIGSQPYTASMVTPFAKQSTDAFGRMTSLSNAFQPFMTKQFQGVASLAGQGGLNPTERLSLGQLAPIAAGQRMQGNPYLDEVIRRSSSDITGANELMASAAGRYGSGSHQGVTQKAIADMAAPLRFADYNTQQQRMDQAIRDQFNMGQQQWGNVTALPGQLGAAYQTAMQPAGTLRAVGGEYEDLMSKQLTDQRRIFDERQQQPWSQIAKLNAMLGGAGQLGGQTMSTSQAPGTSRLMSGLGGAIGGGTLLGPWGALAGGLAGAFA